MEVSWGLKNNDSGENRNPDWYVIHASVCSVSHGCGSVDVWCGVGNYTALSLDHPISRSDNADYRLIKSCLASRPPTTLHCPAFCIFCCRNRAVAGIRCWWPMQNKATQKVIKRPATAAPEPKMQKQCSANLPTCPLVQFFCTTTTREKQAARSQLAVSFTRQSLLFDNLLEREAAKRGRDKHSLKFPENRQKIRLQLRWFKIYIVTICCQFEPQDLIWSEPVRSAIKKFKLGCSPSRDVRNSPSLSLYNLFTVNLTHTCILALTCTLWTCFDLLSPFFWRFWEIFCSIAAWLGRPME